MPGITLCLDATGRLRVYKAVNSGWVVASPNTRTAPVAASTTSPSARSSIDQPTARTPPASAYFSSRMNLSSVFAR